MEELEGDDKMQRNGSSPLMRSRGWKSTREMLRCRGVGSLSM
jgi:hypothetical protein